MNEELAYDIKSSDGFCVSGYFPDKKILDYFIEPKIMITYSGTGYEVCDSNEDRGTFIRYLKENPELYKKYFHNGYFLPSHDKELATIFEIKPKKFDSIEKLINISSKWYELWKLENSYNSDSDYYSDYYSDSDYDSI
jgi:hypothetical protein